VEGNSVYDSFGPSVYDNSAKGWQVAKEYQHRGIGTILLALAIEAVKQKGAHDVFILGCPNNEGFNPKSKDTDLRVKFGFFKDISMGKLKLVLKHDRPLYLGIKGQERSSSLNTASNTASLLLSALVLVFLLLSAVDVVSTLNQSSASPASGSGVLRDFSFRDVEPTKQALRERMLQNPFTADITLEAFLSQIKDQKAQQALASGGLGFLAGETYGGYGKIGERVIGFMPLYEHYVHKRFEIDQDKTIRHYIGVDWDNIEGVMPVIDTKTKRIMTVPVSFYDRDLGYNRDYFVKVYMADAHGCPVLLIRQSEIFYGLYPEDKIDHEMHGDPIISPYDNTGDKERQMAFLGAAFVQVFKAFDGQGHMLADSSIRPAAPDLLRFNEPQLYFVQVAVENDIDYFKHGKDPSGKGQLSIFNNTYTVLTTHTPEAAALPCYDMPPWEATRNWLASHIGREYVRDGCRWIEGDDPRGNEFVADPDRDNRIGLNFAKSLARNERVLIINGVSQEHKLVTRIAILKDFSKKIVGITNGSDPDLWKNQLLLDGEYKSGHDRKCITGKYLFETAKTIKVSDEIEFTLTEEDSQRHTVKVFGLQGYLKKQESLGIIASAFKDPCRPLAGLVRRVVSYKEQQILFDIIPWLVGDPYKEYATPWGRGRGLGWNLLVGGVARDNIGTLWVKRFKQMAQGELKGRLVFVGGSGTELMKLATQASDVWISMPRSTREACGTSDQRAAFNGHLNIATLTGGPVEYIENGVNGWLMDVFSGNYNFSAIFSKATKIYDDARTGINKMYAQLNLPENSSDRFKEIVRRFQLPDADPQKGEIVYFYQKAAQWLLAEYMQRAALIYANDRSRWYEMMKASYEISHRKIGIIRMVNQYSRLFAWARIQDVSIQELGEVFCNIEDESLFEEQGRDSESDLSGLEDGPQCYPAHVEISPEERKKSKVDEEAIHRLRRYIEIGMRMLQIPQDRVDLFFDDRDGKRVAEYVPMKTLSVDIGLGARAPPFQDKPKAGRFQIIINDILRHDVIGHYFYHLNEDRARQVSLDYFLLHPDELEIVADRAFNAKEFGLVFNQHFYFQLISLRESAEQLISIKNYIDLFADEHITLGELESRLGGQDILKAVSDRAVIPTGDGKYFVKIYLDPEKIDLYRAECEFFESHNPTLKPRLFACNEKAQALVLENINNLDVINLFDYMQDTTTSAEDISAAISTIGKGFARIHQSAESKGVVTEADYKAMTVRIFEEVNFLLSKGYNFRTNHLEDFFRSNEQSIIGEEQVYVHGDPVPWNIYVNPVSGELKALIDGEESGYDSRAKELANIILGLIDARKNNPLLIANIDSFINILFASYNDIFQEFQAYDSDIFLERLYFYLTVQLIHGAYICQNKWSMRGWVQFRLSFAEKLIEAGELVINTILNDGIGQMDIAWAGNFDVIDEGYRGYASGKTIYMSQNQFIDVYAEVLISERVGDPIFGHSLSAALQWRDKQTNREWLNCPVEFIEFKGDNFHMKARIKAPEPGQYEVCPVFSVDNGGSWYAACWNNQRLTIEVFGSPIINKTGSKGLRVAVFGDPHGELDGLRLGFEKLNIIKRAGDYRDDAWIMKGVTAVIVGDICDRGSQQKKLYEWCALIRNKAAETQSQLILGNHELMHLQGIADDLTLESQINEFRKKLREDVLKGHIKAVTHLEGRIVVHGGILPHITADTVRRFHPQHLLLIGEELGKEVHDLSDEDIALWLNANLDKLRLDQIAVGFNRRLKEAAAIDDFSPERDIIFARGNAHFSPVHKGKQEYEPGGIFWADFDNELILTDEELLLPQIVGHHEGRKIRWTPKGRVVNVNLIYKHGFGRNAGALVHDGKFWRAVYFDGRPDEIVPEASNSYLISVVVVVLLLGIILNFIQKHIFSAKSRLAGRLWFSASTGIIKPMLVSPGKKGVLPENLIYDHALSGAVIETDKDKRSSCRIAKLNSGRAKLQNLIDDALDILDKKTESTAAGRIWKKILEQNSREDRIYPILVASNLTFNAVKHIDEHARVFIVLNRNFATTLMDVRTSFKQAAAWIMAERLFHELGHDNNIKDREEEIQEEVRQIFRDLILYMSCLRNSPFSQAIARFFQSGRIKHRMQFRSGNYFRFLERLAGLMHNGELKTLRQDIEAFVRSRMPQNFRAIKTMLIESADYSLLKRYSLYTDLIFQDDCVQLVLTLDKPYYRRVYLVSRHEFELLVSDHEADNEIEMVEEYRGNHLAFGASDYEQRYKAIICDVMRIAFLALVYAVGSELEKGQALKASQLIYGSDYCFGFITNLQYRNDKINIFTSESGSLDIGYATLNRTGHQETGHWYLPVSLGRLVDSKFLNGWLGIYPTLPSLIAEDTQNHLLNLHEQAVRDKNMSIVYMGMELPAARTRIYTIKPSSNSIDINTLIIFFGASLLLTMGFQWNPGRRLSSDLKTLDEPGLRSQSNSYLLPAFLILVNLFIFYLTVVTVKKIILKINHLLYNRRYVGNLTLGRASAVNPIHFETNHDVVKAFRKGKVAVIFGCDGMGEIDLAGAGSRAFAKELARSTKESLNNQQNLTEQFIVENVMVRGVYSAREELLRVVEKEIISRVGSQVGLALSFVLIWHEPGENLRVFTLQVGDSRAYCYIPSNSEFFPLMIESLYRKCFSSSDIDRNYLGQEYILINGDVITSGLSEKAQVALGIIAKKQDLLATTTTDNVFEKKRDNIFENRNVVDTLIECHEDSGQVFFEDLIPQVFVHSLDANKEHVFLVTTDGLHDPLSDEEIATNLEKQLGISASPQDMAEYLVLEAQAKLDYIEGLRPAIVKIFDFLHNHQNALFIALSRKNPELANRFSRFAEYSSNLGQFVGVSRNTFNLVSAPRILVPAKREQVAPMSFYAWQDYNQYIWSLYGMNQQVEPGFYEPKLYRPGFVLYRAILDIKELIDSVTIEISNLIRANEEELKKKGLPDHIKEHYDSSNKIFNQVLDEIFSWVLDELDQVLKIAKRKDFVRIKADDVSVAVAHVNPYTGESSKADSVNSEKSSSALDLLMYVSLLLAVSVLALAKFNPAAEHIHIDFEVPANSANPRDKDLRSLFLSAEIFNQDWIDRLVNTAKDPEAISFIARDGEKVVGCIACAVPSSREIRKYMSKPLEDSGIEIALDGNSHYMVGIAVDPAYRGFGIGSELVKRYVQEVIQRKKFRFIVIHRMKFRFRGRETQEKSLSAILFRFFRPSIIEFGHSVYSKRGSLLIIDLKPDAGSAQDDSRQQSNNTELLGFMLIGFAIFVLAIKALYRHLITAVKERPIKLKAIEELEIIQDNKAESIGLPALRNMYKQEKDKKVKEAIIKSIASLQTRISRLRVTESEYLTSSIYVPAQYSIKRLEEMLKDESDFAAREQIINNLISLRRYAGIEMPKTRQVVVDRGSYDEVHLTVYPKACSSFDAQMNNSLRQVKAVLGNRGVILKQTALVRADSQEHFLARKKALLNIIGPNAPPTSIVNQAPADYLDIAIDCLIAFPKLDENIVVVYEQIDDMRYTVLKYSGLRWVYAAGLTYEQVTGTRGQSRKALRLMKKILEAEGMVFSDVLRQWNYIPDIIGSTPGFIKRLSLLFDGQLAEFPARLLFLFQRKRQNYQIFNDSRGIFYSQSRFYNGYPAATGIGQAAGSVVLEFIALDCTKRSDVIVKGIKNTLQVDAHRYSQEKLKGKPGFRQKKKATPKFERAKIVLVKKGDYVYVHFYVSGTAAIRGEETQPEGIENQTRLTLENIANLLTRENLEIKENLGMIKNAEVQALLDSVKQLQIVTLRGYIKNPEEVTAVEQAVQEYDAFKVAASSFVIADVCRDKLLVEIEAEAAAKIRYKPKIVERSDRKFEEKIKVIPLGGVDSPGASSFYVKAGKTRFLFDCGQGVNSGQFFMPSFHLIDEGIDFIAVSHQHIDHIGCLPEAMALFGEVPVFATELTAEHIVIALNDLINKRKQNRRIASLPGVTANQAARDVYRVTQNLRKVPIVSNTDDAEFYAVNGLIDDIKISFQPAGHILGASAITVATPYGNIFYSGDFSKEESLSTSGIQKPKAPVDIMISEATYGSRIRIDDRERRGLELALAVRNTYQRGGTVLIPVFALGRATEVVLTLLKHRDSGIIPEDMPIYLDGAAAGMFKIDMRNRHLMPGSTEEIIQKLNFVQGEFEWGNGLYRVHKDDRKDIAFKNCCIIATSGMMIPGTLSASFYLPRILPRKNNSLILVGYQAPGTPGSSLLNRRQGEGFRLAGRRIAVGAQVHNISLSAHADCHELLDFIQEVNPGQLILIHADKEAKTSLTSSLVHSGFDLSIISLPGLGQEVGEQADIDILTREREFAEIQASGILSSSIAPIKRASDLKAIKIKEDELARQERYRRSIISESEKSFIVVDILTSEHVAWSVQVLNYFDWLIKNQQGKGSNTAMSLVRREFQDLIPRFREAGLDINELRFWKPDEFWHLWGYTAQDIKGFDSIEALRLSVQKKIARLKTVKNSNPDNNSINLIILSVIAVFSYIILRLRRNETVEWYKVIVVTAYAAVALGIFGYTVYIISGGSAAWLIRTIELNFAFIFNDFSLLKKPLLAAVIGLLAALFLEFIQTRRRGVYLARKIRRFSFYSTSKKPDPLFIQIRTSLFLLAEDIQESKDPKNIFQSLNSMWVYLISQWHDLENSMFKELSYAKQAGREPVLNRYKRALLEDLRCDVVQPFEDILKSWAASFGRKEIYRLYLQWAAFRLNNLQKRLLELERQKSLSKVMASWDFYDERSGCKISVPYRVRTDQETLDIEEIKTAREILDKVLKNLNDLLDIIDEYASLRKLNRVLDNSPALKQKSFFSMDHAADIIELLDARFYNIDIGYAGTYLLHLNSIIKHTFFHDLVRSLMGFISFISTVFSKQAGYEISLDSENNLSSGVYIFVFIVLSLFCLGLFVYYTEHSRYIETNSYTKLERLYERDILSLVYSMGFDQTPFRPDEHSEEVRQALEDCGPEHYQRGPLGIILYSLKELKKNLLHGKDWTQLEWPDNAMKITAKKTRDNLRVTFVNFLPDTALSFERAVKRGQTTSAVVNEFYGYAVGLSNIITFIKQGIIKATLDVEWGNEHWIVSGQRQKVENLGLNWFSPKHTIVSDDRRAKIRVKKRVKITLTADRNQRIKHVLNSSNNTALLIMGITAGLLWVNFESGLLAAEGLIDRLGLKGFKLDISEQSRDSLSFTVWFIFLLAIAGIIIRGFSFIQTRKLNTYIKQFEHSPGLYKPKMLSQEQGQKIIGLRPGTPVSLEVGLITDESEYVYVQLGKDKKGFYVVALEEVESKTVEASPRIYFIKYLALGRDPDSGKLLISAKRYLRQRDFELDFSCSENTPRVQMTFEPVSGNRLKADFKVRGGNINVPVLDRKKVKTAVCEGKNVRKALEAKVRLITEGGEKDIDYQIWRLANAEYVITTPESSIFSKVGTADQQAYYSYEEAKRAIKKWSSDLFEWQAKRDKMFSYILERISTFGLFILFVCHANINRSAAMYLITINEVVKNSWEDNIAVFSGGVGKFGSNALDPVVRINAENSGIDQSFIDGFSSAILKAESFEVNSSDVIFVAEEKHRQKILGLVKSSVLSAVEEKTFLFNELLPVYDSRYASDIFDGNVFDEIKDTLERYLFPVFAEGMRQYGLRGADRPDLESRSFSLCSYFIIPAVLMFLIPGRKTFYPGMAAKGSSKPDITLERTRHEKAFRLVSRFDPAWNRNKAVKTIAEAAESLMYSLVDDSLDFELLRVNIHGQAGRRLLEVNYEFQTITIDIHWQVFDILAENPASEVIADIRKHELKELKYLEHEIEVFQARRDNHSGYEPTFAFREYHESATWQSLGDFFRNPATMLKFLKEVKRYGINLSDEYKSQLDILAYQYRRHNGAKYKFAFVISKWLNRINSFFQQALIIISKILHYILAILIKLRKNLRPKKRKIVRKRLKENSLILSLAEIFGLGIEDAIGVFIGKGIGIDDLRGFELNLSSALRIIKSSYKISGLFVSGPGIVVLFYPQKATYEADVNPRALYLHIPDFKNNPGLWQVRPYDYQGTVLNQRGNNALDHYIKIYDDGKNFIGPRLISGNNQFGESNNISLELLFYAVLTIFLALIIYSIVKIYERVQSCLQEKHILKKAETMWRLQNHIYQKSNKPLPIFRYNPFVLQVIVFILTVMLIGFWEQITAILKNLLDSSDRGQSRSLLSGFYLGLAALTMSYFRPKPGQDKSIKRLFVPNEKSLARNTQDYAKFLHISDLGSTLDNALTKAAVYADFGCGIGRAPVEEADQNNRLRAYGVDIIQWQEQDLASPVNEFDWNEFAEKRTRLEKEGRYEFIEGDITNVRLPENADCITSFFTLQYVEDPIRAYLNMYNQLNRGGVMVAALVIPKRADTLKYYDHLTSQMASVFICELSSFDGEDANIYLIVVRKFSNREYHWNMILKGYSEIEVNVGTETFTVRAPRYIDQGSAEAMRMENLIDRDSNSNELSGLLIIGLGVLLNWLRTKSEGAGYFGNIIPSRHKGAIEGAINRGDYKPIEDFNCLVSIIEDIPVRFYQLTAVVPRAPPQFIWTKKPDHILEIYFSNEWLANRFREIFPEELSTALRAVAFHEYQEMVKGKAHRGARDTTLRQFNDIALKVESIFAQIEHVTMRPVPGDNIPIALGDEVEIETLIRTTLETSRELIEVQIYSNINKGEWQAIDVLQENIKPGYGERGEAVPGTWFVNFKLRPEYLGHYEFTTRARIKGRPDSDFKYAYDGGNVSLQVHNTP
ncbi:MAG: GNAT family N-acetyltransferase, partial [Candidatus Omnitrophica bacterium]|nr:GNAT family N-acetyltransferase [Candidatus Omnitrophota bacterium]